MIRIDRIKKLRDLLAQHPDIHDQNTWGVKRPDGTIKACAGGWAIMLFSPKRRLSVVDRGFLLPDGANFYSEAQATLGLSDEQADALFYTAGSRTSALKMLDLLISTGGTCTLQDIQRRA